MGRTPRLFANKFYLHQDRVVIGCLEEKLFNDTRDEYLGTKVFDTKFYAQQDFVIHQVPGDPPTTFKMGTQLQAMLEFVICACNTLHMGEKWLLNVLVCWGISGADLVATQLR
ncbi:beta-1,3-galactosyl-O-glycosyl-glycoprotein beta-1,6-N-acetylglucosaminyltransferase [Elysia marginata]|uniref:Beta-1,3-galactosyl-O-glycosyl-glycoprotein beta-1,6-N-acetylglucosaminyltransferase n=1 Tax=Elysia marginata TaxID=1093978 RepID=A0AAV4G9A9_9GAST|nr:beta-1,3-galactosyl-O-glycosyl-glycoprotein beta-1,6-N-acetylglucosaminyltransferase [Elysia marginata]